MRPAEIHEVSRSRFNVYKGLIFFLLFVLHNRERNSAEFNELRILYPLLLVHRKDLRLKEE